MLIIGAGTFGTSTACHLAQKYEDPSRIIIVDSSPSPPTPAASVDVNRVIRGDYPNPLYCDLASEAIHPWFWSLDLGHHFHKTGWIMMDEKGSDLAKRIRKVFNDRGSTQTDPMSLEELNERWDGLLRGTDAEGVGDIYWNPEAGWCDAAGATASFMAAAEKRGVKRVTAQVSELLLNSTGIEGVRTADGQTLKADKIVLAVGAWTSCLLSPIEDQLDIPEHDRVERQVKATGTVSVYYKLAEEEEKRLSKANIPIIVYGGQGEVIPSTRDGNRLLKFNNSQTTFFNTVTTKSGHQISVPSEHSQLDVPEGIKRETIQNLVSKLLPEFSRNKDPEHWRICWDAVTPTEDLLMCKHPHPKLANLFLATGGSFHGYKFLPIAGKYMLNVLDGESNGPERDKAWSWKRDVKPGTRGFGALGLKMAPKRELQDFENERQRASL